MIARPRAAEGRTIVRQIAAKLAAADLLTEAGVRAACEAHGLPFDTYDGRYDMLAPERTWQWAHRGGLRSWVVGFQSAMLADRFADIVRAGYGNLEEARATARLWLGRFGATDEEVANG